MDWHTYIIFLIQLAAFLCLFFHKQQRFLGLSPRTWSLLLLVAAAVGISVSLYHDASTPLQGIYF